MITNNMINKFTKDIVNKVVEEFNQDGNREHLEKNVIDPIVCYILNRLYPYIFITAIIFVVLLILAILILIILLRKK